MKRQNRNNVSRKQRRASRGNYTNNFYIPGQDLSHGRKGGASIGFIKSMLQAMGLMKG